jgi:hypothetical protein
MWNDRQDNVLIPTDHEVESPAAIHPGLPDVAHLVVLLGVQGWMCKLVEQKSKLLGNAFRTSGSSAA